MSADNAAQPNLRRLRGSITERRIRVRSRTDIPVFSVTNSSGIQTADQTFSKQVYSRELANYKILEPGWYAYNPSRIDVGSIARNDLGITGCISPFYTVFSLDDPTIDPEFFRHFVFSKRFNDRVNANLQGSVRDVLTFDALETFLACIPDNAEQLGISKVLQSIEDTVVRTQELLKSLAVAKTEVMRSELQSNVPIADTVLLGSLLAEGPKSGLSPVVTNNPQGTAVLRLGALSGSTISWQGNVKYAEIDTQEATRFQVRSGDFLVIRGNGSLDITGAGALLREQDVPPFPCIYPDLMIRLRFDPNKTSSQFVAAIWDLPVIRKQIAKAAKSTNGIWKINQTEIKELRIPLPDKTKRERIVNLYLGFNERLNREAAFLDYLQEVRAALVQELLSGRLRLPASMVARFANEQSQPMTASA